MNSKANSVLGFGGMVKYNQLKLVVTAVIDRSIPLEVQLPWYVSHPYYHKSIA